MKKKTNISKRWLYQKYIIENLTIKEIAEIKSCSLSTIFRSLTKNKISKPLCVQRNKFEITKELLEKLYLEEKLSQYKIAKITNSNQPIISFYMKKFQIPSRSFEENFGEEKHPRLGKENKWGHHTEEHKQKISARMSGKNNPMYGKKVSQETRQKISIHLSGKNNPMYGKCGALAPAYKNPEERINPLYQQIRTCSKYVDWRNICMKNDFFTCQICRDNTGGNLIVHHKKYFSKIIKENEIESLEQSFNCNELWDLNNGITLCENCHIQVHSI